MISQFELGKPEERRKSEKHANGIFWIILLNLGIYIADHVFQVQNISIFVVDTLLFIIITFMMTYNFRA